MQDHFLRHLSIFSSRVKEAAFKDHSWGLEKCCDFLNTSIATVFVSYLVLPRGRRHHFCVISIKIKKAMASLTQWTWVWVNSRSWWWTGRRVAVHGVAKSRTWLSDWTKLNWTGISGCHELDHSRLFGGSGILPLCSDSDHVAAVFCNKICCGGWYSVRCNSCPSGLRHS